MINLLPANDQRNLRAARANTLLLRYIIGFMIVFAFMLVALVGTYFVLTIGKAAAENTIAENQAKQSSYAKVQQEATEFKNNLATAKQIFDGQINYSSLILDITRALPSGVILQNLSLDAATFGQPTTLTARATSYESALALKDSFGAKTELFSDVSIQSIATEQSDKEYPFNVTLNLTITKKAAS